MDCYTTAIEHETQHIISRFDMSCAQAHWVGSSQSIICATNRI